MSEKHPSDRLADLIATAHAVAQVHSAQHNNAHANDEERVANDKGKNKDGNRSRLVDDELKRAGRERTKSLYGHPRQQPGELVGASSEGQR
jgi:hypothetical protein